MKYGVALHTDGDWRYTVRGLSLELYFTLMKFGGGLVLLYVSELCDEGV